MSEPGIGRNAQGRLQQARRADRRRPGVRAPTGGDVMTCPKCGAELEDPALGDQRLVPLAAVLDVLRNEWVPGAAYTTEGVNKYAVEALRRTFGGEPDER